MTFQISTTNWLSGILRPTLSRQISEHGTRASGSEARISRQLGSGLETGLLKTRVAVILCSWHRAGRLIGADVKDFAVDERCEDRRIAVAALVRTALGRLAANDGDPRIGMIIDNQRWWRHSQEIFIGLRPRGWDIPAEVPIIGWLDAFGEMAHVREAYAADPVLRDRVDSMIGATGTLQARIFAWLLVQHVVEPVVLATASYEFDERVFDQIFDAFDRGLSSDTVHMVEFLPLNGFESNEDVIPLPDGLVLRRMSDRQMSAAIDQLAVPHMTGGSVNGVRVSRFDQ